jgi:hypothetical protein
LFSFRIVYRFHQLDLSLSPTAEIVGDTVVVTETRGAISAAMRQRIEADTEYTGIATLMGTMANQEKVKAFENSQQKVTFQPPKRVSTNVKYEASYREASLPDEPKRDFLIMKWRPIETSEGPKKLGAKK